MNPIKNSLFNLKTAAKLLSLRSSMIGLFVALSFLPLVAQEVHWDPSSGEFEEGKTETLRLIFEQCAPETEVQLPEVDGLKFGRPSQSRQMQVVNFKVSQRVELVYPVEATRKGKIVIPAFEVVSNKGVLPINEVAFTGVESTHGASIGGNSGGNPNASRPTNKQGGADAVKSFLKSQPNIVWVGQVVDLVYELYVSSRYEGNIAGQIEWKPSGLVLENWEEMQQNQNVFNGLNYAGARTKTRAIFDETAVGTTFAPLQQKLEIRTGSGGFFSFPQIERHTVKTTLSEIQVKALPQPPAEFLKAVGQFKIKSTVVPKQVTVGEPVTWTVTLEGTGNWPIGLSLPAREVSQNFRVIQPRANQTNIKNKLFDASLAEDVVLIPEKEGSYPLGPVRFIYFDPSSGTYKTIETESVSVTVKPPLHPIAQNDNHQAPSSTKGASSAQDEFDWTPQLPRDPLVGWSWGIKPLAQIIWFEGLFLFFSFCSIFWLKKAYDRVPTTEPHRSKRIALKEMNQALLTVEQAPLESLRLWRGAVIQFLGIPSAVPTPEEISESMKNWGGVDSEWKKLWNLSDDRLFSQSDLLDPQWKPLAQTAHLSIRIPKINRWRLFKMENLFPLIALCFIFIFSAGEASDFESLYRDGKFDEAQSLLLETLKSNPTHGRAHAHLSLCFIQKNEWNLAYAHALTAWLLDPQNSCLRWNLELTQQKSHLPLNGIEPLYRSYRNLAGWCSVFVWQMIGWGGALLLFWGVSRSLSRLYQTGRPIRRLDQAGVALGLILLGVACFALYQYELLGNPRVMVLVQEAELKSIPTDLSEGVQSRKIPAGTIALMKKEFLGWVKIKLPQNEEGWIRKSTGLPLYSTYQE